MYVLSACALGTSEFDDTSVQTSARLLQANGVDAAIITVTARHHGRPMPGLQVRLDADPFDVEQPSGRTNVNGAISGRVTSRRAGTTPVVVLVRDGNMSTQIASDVTLEFLAVPGPAAAFSLRDPQPMRAGKPWSGTLAAVDVFGNTAPDYRGRVQVRAQDPQATLPPPLVFGPAERGEAPVTGVILPTPGTQALLFADTARADLCGVQYFDVGPADPIDLPPVAE